MDPVRLDISLVQIRLGAGYLVLDRRIGDVAVYLIQIRFKDLADPRRVPEPCRANDSLICRAQTQELGDYGVPITLDPLNGYA